MDSNRTSAEQPLPLQGIRILDLTRLLPGPLCTQHLADMGADVIKIEEPGSGDPARWMGRQIGGSSAEFAVMNQNKRSLTLDLKQPAAVNLLLRLAESADALIEGYRPGVAARLGIGWTTLKTRNPRLVYASISGYGQTGPLAGKAGHDLNYQALSGVLDQCGVAGGPPAISNFQVGDIAGGSLSAAMSICAALLGAVRTGQGRWLDIAMTDCLQANAVIANAALIAGEDPPPRSQGPLTGGLACYGVYRTADDRWLAVGALEPKFWFEVCRVLNRPDLEAGGHAGGDPGAACRASLAEEIASRPLSDWVALFADTDCCVTPVLSPREAMDSDRARQRGLVLEEGHASRGNGRGTAFPVPFPESTAAVRRPTPGLGEHTDGILSELGLSDSAIRTLRQDGVV